MVECLLSLTSCGIYLAVGIWKQMPAHLFKYHWQFYAGVEGEEEPSLSGNNLVIIF